MNPKVVADVAIKAAAKAGPAFKKAAPAIKKASPVVKKAIKAAGPAAEKAIPYVKEYGPYVAAPVAGVAKKVKEVFAKTDSSGERIFKYNLMKLTELLKKHDITIDMYNYLANEVSEHIDILRKGGKVFEGYFEKLSKIKDMTQEEDLIAEYELARDTWIAAMGKKKD